MGGLIGVGLKPLPGPIGGAVVDGQHLEVVGVLEVFEGAEGGLESRLVVEAGNDDRNGGGHARTVLGGRISRWRFFYRVDLGRAR